jgi:hypothetical protein
MKVKTCYINYAYRNITRNTLEFWDIVSTFSVKAGTKKTDNRADEITLVEEINDHYDCESDVSELHVCNIGVTTTCVKMLL